MAVNRQGKSKVVLRVLIGSLLLAWILHVIFLNEARQRLGEQGRKWEALSRSEQWRQAWVHGPEALWQTLTLIPAGPLLLSFLLMALVLSVGVLRWRMALRVQGLALGGGRALQISLVAHFFNSFLLGATGGDLMKAYYAARETHHKKTEAVLTVFVDRLVGLWAMLLFAGIMMLGNLSLLAQNERVRLLALGILGMLVACTLLVGLAFYGGVSRSWGGARAWLRRLPKGEWLERSLDSCRRFGAHRGFVPKALALSMLLNLITVLQVFVLSRGLQQSVPLTALMLIVPMIICISAIPITPSGLGVRENLFVLLLTGPALGVPATSALSLSLLAFAGSLFWSLVGGLVYMAMKDRPRLQKEGLTQEPPPDLRRSGPRLPSDQQMR